MQPAHPAGVELDGARVLMAGATGRLADGGSVVLLSASKAALSAWASVLRRELRGRSISVLDVRPPHLDTGLVDRAPAGESPRLPAGHDRAELVSAVLDGLRDGSREIGLDPEERRLVRR